MIRKRTGKPVELTMRTMCTWAELEHQVQTPLGGCHRGQSCSVTQGFEPANLDLTGVKSKILPLRYG